MSIQTYDHHSFTGSRLAELKNQQAETVTVALPARNEAQTIGPIIETIHNELVDGISLVDELLVIDDRSDDDTAALARKAGATVYPAGEILTDYDRPVDGVQVGGKGEALWKSLYVSTGSLIIWCDADIRNYDNRFLVGCLGPLLTNPAVGFVKGFYRRPLRDDGEGGGRVTELVARPLISTLAPSLDGLVQPLSGEFGGRRDLLESVPFSRGYAVDLALLIDLADRHGVDIMAQVDLGSRIHRNRPLRELGPQAAAIITMALGKATDYQPTDPDRLELLRPSIGDKTIRIGELPPIAQFR